MLLQFGDVSGQRGFVGPAHQVVADHFRRSQRRLAAGPEADQQTGDDRTVRLNLDAVLVVTNAKFRLQSIADVWLLAGGGGGSGSGGSYQGGAGGSGVVILAIPTNRYTGTTTGSPTVTTSGTDTILKFTASGSYTA